MERVDFGADGIIANDPGIGIAIAGGTSPPADNAIGYAPSCFFVHTDASTDATRLYVNRGTRAAANFDPLNDSLAGSISGSDVVINSTNEMNFQFGGISALAIDDAAITGNTAAADNGGISVYIETQDGGAAIADDGNPAGSFFLTAGQGTAAVASSGSPGGESGSISLVAQAGGAGDGAGAAGADGAIRLISPTGVIFQKHALTTKTTTATLTAAELLTGLLSTTGTSYTVTLPSGTDLDAGITSVVGANEYFEFSVVNTASGTVTIAVGSGSWTSLGTLTVATLTSARFRVARTAGNTFVLYRIA